MTGPEPAPANEDTIISPAGEQPKVVDVAKIDLEMVSMQSGYRVGFLPPKPNSLAAGELFIEIGTEPGAAPRLWVGAVRSDDGFTGNITSLVPEGVELPEPVEPPPTQPPINVDVPMVAPYEAKPGDTLSCTMGNWQNMSDGNYRYQWQRDGVEFIGTDSASYVVVDDDIDGEISCVVTAENAIGETEAPASNAAMIVAAP